jgi:hypothetical protein
MTIAECKENMRLPEFGTKVRIADTIATNEECASFLVHNRHIEARKPGSVGTYHGYVPGAGGDVWWVLHEDNTVGAYEFTEVFDLEENDGTGVI